MSCLKAAVFTLLFVCKVTNYFPIYQTFAQKKSHPTHKVRRSEAPRRREVRAEAPSSLTPTHMARRSEAPRRGEVRWRGGSRAARKRPATAATSPVVRRKPNRLRTPLIFQKKFLPLQKNPKREQIQISHTSPRPPIRRPTPAHRHHRFSALRLILCRIISSNAFTHHSGHQINPMDNPLWLGQNHPIHRCGNPRKRRHPPYSAQISPSIVAIYFFFLIFFTKNRKKHQKIWSLQKKTVNLHRKTPKR